MSVVCRPIRLYTRFSNIVSLLFFMRVSGSWQDGHSDPVHAHSVSRCVLKIVNEESFFPLISKLETTSTAMYGLGL